MQYLHKHDFNLINLLTYLIYTKSKSPQKGIPPARHGTRQFFSEFIFTRDENASTFDKISTFFYLLRSYYAFNVDYFCEKFI